MNGPHGLPAVVHSEMRSHPVAGSPGRFRADRATTARKDDRDARCCHRQSGMAIGLILIALALVGILAVSLAASNSGNFFQIENQQSKTYAGIILKQASNWHDAHTLKQYADGKTGYYIVQSDMTDINTGWIEAQQPPNDSFTSASSAQWIYKAINTGQPAVRLANTGSNGWVQTVVLVNLKQPVCEQINYLLQGSTTVPVETVGTSSNWSNPSTVMDLTGETATSGKPNQCVQASDGPYVFYATIQMW